MRARLRRWIHSLHRDWSLSRLWKRRFHALLWRLESVSFQLEELVDLTAELEIEVSALKAQLVGINGDVDDQDDYLFDVDRRLVRVEADVEAIDSILGEAARVAMQALHDEENEEDPSRLEADPFHDDPVVSDDPAAVSEHTVGLAA